VLVRGRNDRGYEAVAALGNGFDKRGPVRGVTQRFSESFDRGIQAGVEINKGVGGPQSGAEFFPSDHLARMFHQLDKYLKRLLLELDPCTVSTQFAGTGIDLKVTEAINRI
jgi:hypothetical protein